MMTRKSTFGMDAEFWEEYHSRQVDANLVKGNVGEDPGRWGGLPKELHPGYKEALTRTTLDNYAIPRSQGGGQIGPWKCTLGESDAVSFMRHLLWNEFTSPTDKEDHVDGSIAMFDMCRKASSFQQVGIEYYIDFPVFGIEKGESEPDSNRQVERFMSWSLDDWIARTVEMDELKEHMMRIVDGRLLELIEKHK